MKSNEKLKLSEIIAKLISSLEPLPLWIIIRLSSNYVHKLSQFLIFTGVALKGYPSQKFKFYHGLGGPQGPAEKCVNVL